MTPFQFILCWLAAVNILTVIAFAYDKRAAAAGKWRIFENTLLLLTLVGGSVGAVAGQQLLRHKTVKQPFRLTLCLILVVQIAVLAIWLLRMDLIRSMIG